MTRKFITCSNCGKKIYENEEVIFAEGICYRCCSSACLSNLMLNVKCATLDDGFMSHFEEEWEGVEERNDVDSVMKAIRCFAVDKDFNEQWCEGCAFENSSLCHENMSDGLAKLCLSTFENLISENKALTKSRDKWKEIANVFDAAIREYEKMDEGEKND